MPRPPGGHHSGTGLGRGWGRTGAAGRPRAGAAIHLPAEPSTCTREGHLIAHKNDLLGV